MATFEFCLLHCDYEVRGTGGSQRPVVRLWGKNRQGKNIVVLDSSFVPYFFVQYSNSMGSAELSMLRKRITEMTVEETSPLKVEEASKRYLGREVKLLKVYVPLPSQVSRFREQLKDWRDIEQEYEYSIPFYRRYLIDKGIVPMEWVRTEGKKRRKADYCVDLVIDAGSVSPVDKGPRQWHSAPDYPSIRILAFDIETMGENQENVVMISVTDNKGLSKTITTGRKARGVEHVKDEKALISRFAEIVRKRNPDMLVGYNTDNFDFQKLADASARCGLDIAIGRDEKPLTFMRRGRSSSAQISGRAHLDLYPFISNILADSMSTEIFTLDRVSREIVGEGKKQLSWDDMKKAWKDGKTGIIGEYCLRDSELALKLADSILPQIFEISRISGQTPFDCIRMTYSQLVEWVLIRKACSIGELIPNMPHYGEINARRRAAPYTGGYVLQPKDGLHENIALFDFTSLYPSIIITHNVSPETLDKDSCKPSDRHQVPGSEHFFCSERGFVPMVIEELISARKEIKARMRKTTPRHKEYRLLNSRQYALKIIANASYGYYGYAGSRWYSRICAESITAWGRMYIKKVISIAESRGHDVVYGDTDSLFVKIGTRRQARALLRELNKCLPGVMELDFTGFYRLGLFVMSKSGTAAKKKYALIDSKGEMTIRGFERVRRDWSDIAKKTQESVLKAILRDRSPEKAARTVRRVIKKLRGGSIDIKDLVIYTQISKPLGSYEQVGPHVVAARKMVAGGKKVKEGSTVAYVITKGPGSISSRAEPVDSHNLQNVDYDPDYYIHNQLLPAAMRVLSGVGYKEEDLLGKDKLEQVSLSDFVKK